MGHKLYLAPMRGYTDAVFRNTFLKYFKGIDGAMAPFVPTLKGHRIKPSQIRDLVPENNRGMPLVPQILSKSPGDFTFLARHLFDLGYTVVNWNLGCPFPMVAKKGRGSGLLPFPDKIEAFLSAIIPAIPCALSIKLRLGRNNAAEIFRLLPILNRYPLAELIVHPRTGVQMYEGDIDLDSFEKCLSLSKHPVTYNGDITTLDDFIQLSDRFTGIKSWMIGRGVITNPFLPAVIKSGKDPFENKIETLHCFHDDLYGGYLDIFQGPSHLVERMKGFWKYFALSFEDSRKIQKKIFKTKTAHQYESVVKHFFESEAQWRLTPMKYIG